MSAPEPEKLRRMAEEWYVSYDIEATDLVDSVARLLERVVRECAAKSRWPSDEYGILRAFGLSPLAESKP